MDAYSKNLQRGVGGGDDGEKKVRRLESRTEEVDLSLGLSLGGLFAADRRSGEGLVGSSSATPQGSGFALDGVVVEPSPLLLATLQWSGFLGSAAGVQPSATLQRSGFPWSSIKEEPVEGTPSAEGRSLPSAIVSNGVMATASSPASALIAAALGSGGEQQDASERPAAMVRQMPLVWASGISNGMRTVGFLYEYNRVDKVRIMCVCHGSFLTPAEFVEHAGGGQVANPLRSIIVKTPSWL